MRLCRLAGWLNSLQDYAARFKDSVQTTIADNVSMKLIIADMRVNLYKHNMILTGEIVSSGLTMVAQRIKLWETGPQL